MFGFLDLWVQNPIVMILLLVAGFVFLVKGADWLVDGASGLAKRWGVTDLVIGLTVVAFGTSMPEFVVNIISALSGNNELAITNILGSNSINIFVILGLTALIWPVSSKVQSRKVDIPIACLASLLVLFFACYTRPQPLNWDLASQFSMADSNDYITRIGGIVLVVCFFFYMIYLFRHAKENSDENETFTPMAVWKALLLIVVGLVGLTIGGQFIVKSATQMAHSLGLSDAIIGLTVVALGTSLPELATSCMAAAKKNCDLALGNCVGSCIFNVFFVLGITSCITPLAAYKGLFLDAMMSFLAPLMVLLFVCNDKKKEISRLEGGVLLMVYAGYLGFRIFTL